MTLSTQEYRLRLKEIYKLSSILINNVEQENSLKDILESTCSLLNLETGNICIIDGEKITYYEHFCQIDDGIVKNTTVNLKDTFCDIAIKANKLIAINDLSDSAYKNHKGRLKNNINCYIGLPIHFNEGGKGAINFSSSVAKKTEFSAADIDLVNYLGQWVSQYLDRKSFKKSLKNKNLQLEQLNQELEKKNEDLEQIMKEKNQLLQILVHDLKSPLSNIKMLSYLFQEFVTNDESEELIGIFNKSLDYVFHLIEQMETLNSVENFPLNAYAEQFNLNSFLTETVKSFNSVAEAKGIKLIYNSKVKENTISTDMNFLKRISHNVISNAIKFSPFNKKVTVDLELVKNNFVIKVIDEGPGITAADQEKLFDKFNKLKNKPTNSESSSGLGLFIVKELLKNLKGDIKVKSKVDVGSTFTITLPKSI
ncbi:GAF domain-containing sensor histidine kinase [Pedobacter sp. SD-b]|uniref:histidine kinase n=1 Tax=Pedobacter segetis TaxID=2793069 RepID=A0ABS1BG54_9SPHI|nr:GAF domain-containing sensor histidine kinase [Pedobacter segetis]MBK0381841.1 GAF domain-containing sensor histidine kinase [Pedobacter segetis]